LIITQEQPNKIQTWLQGEYIELMTGRQDYWSNQLERIKVGHMYVCVSDSREYTVRVSRNGWPGGVIREIAVVDTVRVGPCFFICGR
jgi:hypothetical protein